MSLLSRFANMPSFKNAAQLFFRAYILGAFIFFIGIVTIDQTSKFHAEKEFLNWSGAADVRAYRSSKALVFTLGQSPSLMFANGRSTEKPSNHWIDFHVTYVRNPGAAWGSFAGVAEKYRLTGFMVMTIFICGLILFLLKNSTSDQVRARLALLLVLAGAIGNGIDRIFLKYVIDWLQFHWRVFGWEYSFPVFNVADIAINIGVGLMAIDFMLNEIKRVKGKSVELKGNKSV